MKIAAAILSLILTGSCPLACHDRTQWPSGTPRQKTYNWTQAEYKEKINQLIANTRQGLRSGETVLNNKFTKTGKC